jgi:hypothetical protein
VIKQIVMTKKHKDRLLRAAVEYCDKEDKSTEFTLQYMQDVASASLDYVVEFLQKNDKLIIS